MKTQSPDTSPEAEHLQIEIIRRTPLWRRLAQVVELNAACRRFALADVRRKHPHASEAELRRHIAVRLLPRDIVAEVYGDEAQPTPLATLDSVGDARRQET